MSFVLHIIDEPSIKTVQEAGNYIFGQKGERAEPNEKFSQFVQDITATYPDLTDEDEDGDNDENVWLDGLNGGITNSHVYVIGLKTVLVDSYLLSFIANAAAKNGLQIFDGQNGMFYRDDRTIVHQNGFVEPL